MGTLEGKVVFISGGARGQGRAHAVRLAKEGADIITFDIAEQIDSVPYPLATKDDLEETVRQVEALGRRIVARQADVRDQDAVGRVFDEGVAELGRVDIVIANAGIMPIVGPTSTKVSAWHDAIDIMLTGVVYTLEAAVPTMVEQNEGGAIIITSSIAGLKSPARSLRTNTYGLLGYTAAKHAVVGVMRSYANALASHNIRVNTLHPTGANTMMVANDAFLGSADQFPELFEAMSNALPVQLIESDDVANAVAWLVSDEARYITGVSLPVDAGASVR
ncbi:MAG: mycofactocin-coupled SDR family oxidoreductase [Actinomycetota bacterium]|nr:mycofactocin-coupled SDR family oxidoreductase [Actinomycetota bacterium]